jgi:hypothetical protein
MTKKVTKDLDFGPYDKDESEEEETGQNVTPKAVKTTPKTSSKKTAEKADVADAQKEIDDIMTGMNPEQKGRMFVAMGVVAASSAPVDARTKYDHETTMKTPSMIMRLQ